MARKKQERRVPQVPRSVGTSSPTATPTAERPAKSVDVVEKPVTQSSDFAHEYAHVKQDLARIALFGSLIFVGMFILKFAVGL